MGFVRVVIIGDSFFTGGEGAMFCSDEIVHLVVWVVEPSDFMFSIVKDVYMHVNS